MPSQQYSQSTAPLSPVLSVSHRLQAARHSRLRALSVCLRHSLQLHSTLSDPEEPRQTQQLLESQGPLCLLQLLLKLLLLLCLCPLWLGVVAVQQQSQSVL